MKLKTSPAFLLSRTKNSFIIHSSIGQIDEYKVLFFMLIFHKYKNGILNLKRWTLIAKNL